MTLGSSLGAGAAHSVADAHSPATSIQRLPLALWVGGCLLIIGMMWTWRLTHIEVPAEATWLAPEMQAIVRDRLLAGTIVGAVLGIAGLLLRTASSNPLADPEITGVNAGAALGVVAVAALTPAQGAAALLPGGLVGAIAAASITVMVGLRGGHGDLSGVVAIQRMLLLGLAVSAMLSAITAIILVLDEAQLVTVLSWLSGKLGGIRLPDVIPALVISVLVLPLVWWGARGFDALAIGDSVASAIGARPARLRLIATAVAVLLIAPCVAAAGPIGFLGLLSAVVAHRLCGPRHRWGIPVAALSGAAILLLADSIAQWMWAPAETPVGIVTSIVGVPVLLWGIRQVQRRRGRSTKNTAGAARATASAARATPGGERA